MSRSKRWIVEEGPTHMVVRFPWWIPRSARRAAAENICSDAALVGRRMTYKLSHSYVRFDGDVQPERPEPKPLWPDPGETVRYG